jgi:hypothetical protein
MRRLAFIVGLIGFSAVAVAQPDFTAAVKSLNAEAKTKIDWNVKKARYADVTCDGKPDIIMFGVGKNSAWVGISPKGEKPQTMEFGIHSGTRQGSFCGVPNALSVAPIQCSDDSADGKLPGCRQTKGCQEFTVEDQDCDSFHFYWDARQKKIVWWRL